MTDPVAQLALAEAEAIAARARLNVTLAVVQRRLEPRRLAREARQELSDVGTAAAQRGADVARRNPGALAGVVAAAGLLLARHRIAALWRRPPKATGDDAAS